MDKFKRVMKGLKEEKTLSKKEKVKSISIEIFKRHGYNPNEEQTAVHKSSASFKLLVGSPRSGKTATMIIEILTHLLRYPGARGYLSRQHETEFRKTIFSELEKWLKKIPSIISEHIKKEGRVVFTNQSELLYGGLWQAEDKLKGLEISIFGADQIEEMEEIIFKTLASRLSLDIPERKGLLTVNIAIPEWARKRFIETPELFHKHFKLYPQNNKFLPKDYLEKQKEIWGPEMFEAMLKCDLDYIQTEDNVFERDEIKKAFQREKVPGGRSIGVDPARGGYDETVISEKVGNHLRVVEAYRQKDTNYTVERLKKIAGDKEVKIFIDMGSFGAGIYDRLKESGFNIIGVDFSTTPDDPRKYNIRKAEIIFKLKEDLINLSITDDNILEEQLRNVRYKILSSEKIAIETKEERIRRGLKSYDRLMSIALANLSETEKDGDESEIKLSLSQLKLLEHNLLKLEKTMMDIEKNKQISYIKKNEKDCIRQGLIGTGWKKYRSEYDRLIIIYNRFTGKGWHDKNIWSLVSRPREYEYSHIIRYKYSEEDNPDINVDFSLPLFYKKDLE